MQRETIDNALSWARYVVGIILEIFALVLFVTFCVFVLKIEGIYLFAWHPLLLATGFFLCATQALLIYGNMSFLSRYFAAYKSRVSIHLILMAVGLACTAVGSIAIFLYKQTNEQAHFCSLHSQIGLLTLFFCVVSPVLGASTKFHHENRSYFHISRLELCHRIVGISTYLSGGICLIYSLYVDWFKMNFSESAKVIGFIGIISTFIFGVANSTHITFKKAMYKVIVNNDKCDNDHSENIQM